LTYLATGEDSNPQVAATEGTVIRPAMDLSELHDSSVEFTLSPRMTSRTVIASSRDQKQVPRSIWFYVGLTVVGFGLFIAALSSRGQTTSAVVDPVKTANAAPATKTDSQPEPLDAFAHAWNQPTTDNRPAFGSPIPRSYQLAFDGQSSYAVVPSLQYNPTQEYTIEGWFTLLGERQSTTDPVIWSGPRWIAIWEQHHRFGLGTTGTGPTEIVSSNFSAPLMTPVHVAGIWSKSGQTLYVGGKMVMTVDTKSSPYPATSGGFFLGGAPTEFLHHERWYRGGIDEVRISRGSRYRMKNILPLRRFPDRDSDTLALYHMDEGYSEKLTDSSGHGHHGQIVGARWIPELRDPPNPMRKLKP
jgi:hypothetical protein